ncbi:SNARE associated golgi family protein [Trypanosoma rangeli]|uniref:SNARE associated golgi family protein n=1 Tax=Trypanosoma rangeli TaxID=5698 RepID=A0A422NV37_TRYRA|nr:SNARE associated golgi family protein [Trypanosoma rangeli]RNF09314.1 SNARE associated golgi family protein [Trypanosoma rangeli]|eukprot:RNF09314.1 SNARE associated golgi family protein [Trypanosoma rangeli]
MVATAHVADRSGVPSHLIKFVLIIMVVAVLMMYFTGTFALMRDMRRIVQSDTTSLRSAAGIAKLCREIQTLAASQLPQMVVFITVVYLFLQALCVPGTVALNAVMGAVLGTLLGVPYCTLLGTVGASCCYLLSSLVGVRLVERVDGRLMKGKGLAKIRLQVNRYRGELFVYLLFLRFTPILPNWLVNLASPIVGVPLRVFALATFLGILPQTYLTVRFGAFARTTMGNSGPIVSLWDTLLLVVLGVTVLAAFWLKKRLAATTGHASGLRSATAMVV